MRRSRILLVILLIVPAAVARAEDEVSLSLDDCLARALASALEIQAGGFGPELARTYADEAESEFDHLLTFSTSGGRTSVPSTSFFSGAPEVRNQTFDADVTIGAKTRLGTLYSLGFHANRLLTNSEFYSFRPQWTNTLSFEVTQPLLRGAFSDYNEANERIALADLRAAGADFRDVVEGTLAAVERAYWRLAFLERDLELRRQSLATAKELFRVATKRLDAGAGTKIEVVQADAGVAEREKELIGAEAALRDGQDLLRSYVFPFTDEPDRAIRIVPTDKPEVDAAGDLPDVGERIRRAFDLRPDVIAWRERLEAAGIRVTRSENELLPRLDLYGSIDLLGIDDGFSRALEPIPGADYPGWLVGLTLEFPLGNRAAEARHRRAVLERSQLVAGFESLRNRVVVDVRRAVRGIETARRQIEATRKATAAALAQYEAEQDRVRAEKSTNYQLLQVEDDLSRARTQELLAHIGFRDALVLLERATGTYAEWRGLAGPATDEAEPEESSPDR